MKKLLFVSGLIAILSLFSIILTSCQKSFVEKNQLTKSGINSRNKSNVEFTANQIHSLYEVKAGISKFKSRITNNNAEWPLWDKIKDWFHDHTGTYLFQDCNLSLPCGSCPGLCLTGSRFNPTLTEENYELDSAEISEGRGRFTLSLDDEENKLLIGFIDSNFTYEGDFYLANDILMSDELAQHYNKTSILLKAGIYSVYYGDEEGGETLIDVEIVD